MEMMLVFQITPAVSLLYNCRRREYKQQDAEQGQSTHNALWLKHVLNLTWGMQVLDIARQWVVIFSTCHPTMLLFCILNEQQ